MSTTLPAALDFEGTIIQIIDRDGRPWIAAENIGDAFGLKHARTGIQKAFSRHSDEFTGEMTTVVNMTTVDGKTREVRVFSPRGVYALSFFITTDRAKRCRRWILDVLEGLAPSPGPRPPVPIDAELLSTQRKLIDAQEAKIREIEARAAAAVAEAQRTARRTYAQLDREASRLREDLADAQTWLTRAEWALGPMRRDEGIELLGLRGQGRTWTEIARDFSFRSAGSLSAGVRRLIAEGELPGGVL